MEKCKFEEGCKRYKVLNNVNQLRRATDAVREKWWPKQCDKLEEYERSGKIDLLQESIAVVSQKEEETSNINT